MGRLRRADGKVREARDGRGGVEGVGLRVGGQAAGRPAVHAAQLHQRAQQDGGALVVALFVHPQVGLVRGPVDRVQSLLKGRVDRAGYRLRFRALLWILHFRKRWPSAGL